MSASFQVVFLDRAGLMQFVATASSADVTVTGAAGSGFSLVTDVLGEDVHQYDLAERWATRHLLVMRERVPDRTAAVLRSLGLAEVAESVPRLTLGTAILITEEEK